MAAGRPVIKGVVSGPGGDLVFTLTPVKEIPPRTREVVFKLITVRPGPEVMAVGRRFEAIITKMAELGIDTEEEFARHLEEEHETYYDILRESLATRV